MPRQFCVPLTLPFYAAVLLPAFAAAQEPAPQPPSRPEVTVRPVPSDPDQRVEVEVRKAVEKALSEVEGLEGLGDTIREALDRALRATRGDAAARPEGTGPRVRVFVDGVEQEMPDVEELIDGVEVEALETLGPDGVRGLPRRLRAVLRDLPGIGAHGLDADGDVRVLRLGDAEARIEMRTEVEQDDEDAPRVFRFESGDGGKVETHVLRIRGEDTDRPVFVRRVIESPGAEKTRARDSGREAELEAEVRDLRRRVRKLEKALRALKSV